MPNESRSSRKLWRGVLVVVLFLIPCIAFAQDPDSSWTQTYQLADFDSLNVRFVGNWPFADAFAVAYDIIRGVAFLGSGGGVYMLDVSNPSTPVKLSEKIHTQGYVMGLFYESALQRLYVTAEVAGLEIWDVSNLNAPVKLGHCDTPDLARRVFVYDSYAYLADFTCGLRIIDVSAPSDPQEIGFYYTPDYAEDVYVSGTYAYVADGYSGLRVIDVSTPSNPQEVGYCDTPNYATGVYLSGSYAYVADGFSGLRVINISAPSNPYEVGHCDTPHYAWRVYVSGSYAYVADDTTGLRVIDISMPSTPQEIGYYDPIGRVLDVRVSNSYAYIANHVAGLGILDVSTPSNPQAVGDYGARSSALGIYMSGSYAYVADRGAGFRVIDIANPSNPYEVGHCDTPSEAFGVYLSGSYAYVADYETGLRVIDISSPTNPQEMGHCGVPGHARSVFISGSYAYIASSTAGLRILDVSTPSNPVEVGYYDTPGEAYSVFVSGSYAYVADYSGGLRVIDVSTPSNPQEVGYWYTPDKAWDVYVSGVYAYVAAHSAGLRVIDISTPSNPVEVGFHDTPGYAIGVYVLGFFAYVADNPGLLRIIYINSPSNPIEIGHYETGYYPHNSFCVAGSGSYVYVGTYRAGVQVYENLLIPLMTDDPLALAYNGNKHLVREPNTDNLHLVYTNAGNIVYRYSDDGGENWTMAENIFGGESPAICLDAQKNPCIAFMDPPRNRLIFAHKDPLQGWEISRFPFGTSQPTHPCMTMTLSDGAIVDSVHILFRLYTGGLQTNAIKEIAFIISDPQNYRTLTLDNNSGANMVLLDFPAIAGDYTNMLHATWMHGDTVYYGTRAQGVSRWNKWVNPFDPEGRISAHPFVETYGDSVFVAWQNEADDEVYRGAKHLQFPFSWANLSQTSTTPSIYPVNASGMVTTFVDKSSPSSENDIFWKTYPGQPLHNLSNTPAVNSTYPHTSLWISTGQVPQQYTVYLEGNASPYEIKCERSIINPTPPPAYFTTVPGFAIPSLHLAERDSFISDWQIPVDIGYDDVTYEFPLEPDYCYKLKAVVYHQKQDKWKMKVKIDGEEVGEMEYEPFEPETLELVISPAFYADSIIIERRINMLTNSLPYELFEWERI